MKVKEALKSKIEVQKIQLVQGDFTPSEASHIIMSLLDEKINFHKIQRLQILEGNQNIKTRDLDGRIAELESEKKIARTFIGEKRKLGQKLHIDGVLKITVAQEEI